MSAIRVTCALQRWGDDSHLLQQDKDWAEVLKAKTRFCAFLYGNPFFYREAFFRALSRYKPVDAPGRSMNNMPGIDPVPGQIDWKVKVEFLRAYKFVIAFENSSAPGYNTEKLTHAIEADAMPIYWGDPEIGRSFNTGRFINGHDYLPKPRRLLPRLPYAAHSIRNAAPTVLQKLGRRINGHASECEQRLWAAAGFDALVAAGRRARPRRRFVPCPPAAAVSHRQPAAGPLGLGRAVAGNFRGDLSGAASSESS